jgi:uracil-DNA glycosylase family 4
MAVTKRTRKVSVDEKPDNTVESNPCAECPIRGKYPKMHTQGPPDGGIVVVSPVPSLKQVAGQKALSPGMATLFAQLGDQEAIDVREFIYHPYIRCAYDPKTHPSKENKLIKSSCKRYLDEILDQVKPDLIIPLGAEAATAVEGKAVKITKVRGIIRHSERFNSPVLAMNNPGLILMRPENRPTGEADFRTLGNLMDADYSIKEMMDVEYGKYHMITDLQELIDAAPDELSFDLETKGLRPYADGAKIMTMHFCFNNEHSYMLPWDHPESPLTRRDKLRIGKQLKTLLTNPDTFVFGQNLKFDECWIHTKLGFRFRIADDTQILATLIDENQPKNQDDLVKRYVPEMAGYADSFNAGNDKANMDKVPLSDILDYGCGDTLSNYKLFQVLYPIVAEDKRLLQHYRRVAMPGINMFAGVDVVGMEVDEEALDQFEEVMAALVAEQKSSILKKIPKAIKRDHMEKGIELSRADLVRDWLFTHKAGLRLTPKVFTKTTAKLDPHLRVASTSTKDHLPLFFDTNPELVELAEYQKNSRMLGTNIRRFRENYITHGKVYPIYALHVAVTGRTSSRDPNGQNFPKRGQYAKAYRKIFKAPPGYVILEADLSQAELRIAADMADEKTMIDIYRKDGDIHTSTALIVMGVSMATFLKLPKAEQKDARQKAKAVNFGFLYGMWWKSFIIYAKTQYGVEFSEKEAQRIRNDFFDKYSGLLPWHEKMKALALKNKYVRSYDGRKRNLPMVDSPEDYIAQEACRQAINSPVQNFASDLGVMSMARLSQQVDPEYILPFGFVHDAIYVIVKEEHIEWASKTLKHYMESNPLKKWFNLTLKLPIKADVSFGWNLGEVHEMETLTYDDDYDFTQHEGVDIAEQVTPPNNGRMRIPDHLINLEP